MVLLSNWRHWHIKCGWKLPAHCGKFSGGEVIQRQVRWSCSLSGSLPTLVNQWQCHYEKGSYKIWEGMCLQGKLPIKISAKSRQKSWNETSVRTKNTLRLKSSLGNCGNDATINWRGTCNFPFVKTKEIQDCIWNCVWEEMQNHTTIKEPDLEK